MGISERGLRAAMLDTVLQGDIRRERVLIEQLREKSAQVHRINREIKRLSQELMVTQRQIAAIADAISLEIAL